MTLLEAAEKAMVTLTSILDLKVCEHDHKNPERIRTNLMVLDAETSLRQAIAEHVK